MKIVDLHNDLSFNFLICGNSNVGKSTIIHQLIHKQKYIPHTTLGVHLSMYEYVLDKKKIKISLWDIGGLNNNIHFFIKNQIKTIDAAILIYDVSDHQSFIDLEKWLNILNTINSIKNTIIIGNKIDKNRTISNKEASSFALSKSISYYEISSYDDLQSSQFQIPLHNLIFSIYNSWYQFHVDLDEVMWGIPSDKYHQKLIKKKCFFF